MSFYRKQLEDWLKTLDIKADLVFDIGGGQGPVKDRVNSWAVKDYRVLDLPGYDMDKPIPFGPHMQADYIFCLEVFEYLLNPIRAIRNISRGLSPGGKAFVTFAFVYPHHNELERDCLRYTEPAIRKLARTGGLKISNIWYRLDDSGLLQQFYAADGMRAAKQYPHHNVTGFIAEFSK